MARRRKRQFGEIQEIESRVPGRPVRYRARYMGPDGRRYSAPTFASYGEAEAWLNKVQAEVHLGLWTAERASRKTTKKATPTLFAEFAESCIIKSNDQNLWMALGGVT